MFILLRRCAVAGVLLLALRPAPLTAQEPDWTQNTPSTSPPPRLLSSAAYDAARETVVLFGGVTLAPTVLFFSDTWIWDGTNWVVQAPLESPPSRQAPAMAYDAARAQVVLFGGFGVSTFFDDTWTWDGINWTQAIPSTSPSPRQDAAMAYDEARGQVVMFGGRNTNAGASTFNDTWLWNGSDWSLQSPASSPPGRFAPSIVYDSARREVVLFGGFNIGSSGLVLRDDTWVWDGVNWTHLNPPTSAPPLFQPAMAYDAARGQVVLFGGRDVNGVGGNETWLWDGATWTQAIPANNPTARYRPVMAYDAAQRQVVLFGGGDNSNLFLNDTWVWGVGDATPPVLSLPASVVAEATAPNGASVSFVASAVDAVDGPVPIDCSPASGALFAIGTTIVNCAASDARGNRATGSFAVTVQDTTPPIVTATLIALSTGGTNLVALSTGGYGESDQLFRVGFSTTDSVGVVSTAVTLNGVRVSNGQVVRLKPTRKGAQKVRLDDGMLRIEAVSFALSVTASDAAGNSRTVIAVPVFRDGAESKR